VGFLDSHQVKNDFIGGVSVAPALPMGWLLAFLV
jgi:hypothetical protein